MTSENSEMSGSRALKGRMMSGALKDGGALKDDHKVTALPTHSSPYRIPQALMLRILSHHLEG